LDYVMWVVLFLLGIVSALASDGAGGSRHWLLRAGSLCCFMASFSLASLEVLYFGFLLLLLTRSIQVGDRLLSWSTRRYLLHKLDFILLPFFFWFAQRFLFPKHGFYAAYNEFGGSPDTFSSAIFYFCRNGIFLQFNESLRLLTDYPSFGLLLVLLLLSGFRMFRGAFGAFYGDAVRPWRGCAFGALLLVLAVFPYAAVYKFPTFAGPDSRHAILLGLPISILITYGLRLLVPGRGGSISVSAFVTTGALVVVFCVALIGHYLAWETQAVKDHAIMAQLREQPEARQYSVFWVHNRVATEDDPYPWFAWSSLLNEVWHDEAHIGLDTAIIARDHTKLSELGPSLIHRYNAGHVDARGKQATMTIEAGPVLNRSPQTLALRYLVVKYLHPSRLDSWLRETVKVRIEPIAPIREDEMVGNETIGH
jgi:hypothetical protein